MAQAIHNRVIEEIRTLEPDELRQVQRVVEAQLAPIFSEDPDERVLQRMLKAGLITETKRPNRTHNCSHLPVPIQGKPLSETIIEERR